MTALFRRVVNVTVAPKTEGAGGALAAVESALGFDLSNIDCTFDVKKSSKPEPNTCELKIYNLAPETRRILSAPKKLVLRLEAGYPDAVAQIFLGEVRSGHSYRDGTQIVTECSCGDSEKELANGRLNMSIGPKVSPHVALLAIVKELGVAEGNAQVMAQKLAAKGETFFGKGVALYGNAARRMTDICRSADLEWWVDDGVLHIVDLGKALEDKAVLLTPDTGLVGAPTIDNKGVVSVTALIQPDLRPGRKIVLDSLEIKGGFRITECQYTGDTRGQEWFCKMSAKAY